MNNIEILKSNNWKDSNGNLWNDPNLDYWKIYDLSEVKIKYKIIVPSWWSGLNEDKIVMYHVNEFMTSVGRTAEEWYSRFILNLPEVPKCENPKCNNKVKLAENKISHGLRLTCCKSCGQSVSNIKRWNNPNDYLNGNIYKSIKSAEMTANLQIWNYDPKFQAVCQRNRIYNRDSNYVFYIAITKSGSLKYGIYQEYSKDYRLWMQSVYNNDEYVTMIDLFISDNHTIADFEYEIKSNFAFSEYIQITDYNDLKQIIQIVSNKYNLKVIDQLPNELTSTTIEKYKITK